MSDPVDTDALRMLAEDNAAASVVTNGITLVQRRSLSGESMRALRAAADEVDRLREKLSRIACDPLLFAYTRDSVETYGAIVSAMKWVHEEFDGTKRDRDRLRTVIENAPHEPPCPARLPATFTRPMPCTCWKADAL